VLSSIYEFLGNWGYHHPIHPTEVHMPIGLVVGAVIFAILARLFRRERLASAASSCILLAFVWTFPTILFGFMDWQQFYGGAWMFPIKAKIALAPFLALFLFVAVLLGRKYGAASLKVISSYLLCFICVVALGYFGGEMVYIWNKTPSSEEFKKGEMAFITNCRPCHPQGGNVIDPSKPVHRSRELKTFELFDALVREPKGEMPCFSPSEIPEAEMKELYDYIVNVLDRK